ncbi:MAG: ABC transporter permease [Bacillota bacterium]
MHTATQRCLGSELRVFGAMLKKEVLHLVRYPMWIVVAVTNPFLYLLPVLLLGSAFAVRGATPGFAAYTGVQDYVPYLLTGSVLTSYLGTALWSIGQSLRTEMLQGTLEQNWLTPTHRITMLLSRTAQSMTRTTLALIIVWAVIWWLFGFKLTANYGLAFLIILLSFLALVGVGFMFAAFVLLYKEANAVTNMLQISLPLLIGAYYPVAVLPGWLQVVAKAIPLTYGVDALRHVLVGSNTLLPLQTEVAILAAFAAFTAVAGWQCFKLVERRCRRLGNLGQY